MTRRVAVTGAASGIGAAVAALLRSAGYCVVGLDRAPMAGVDETIAVDLVDEVAVDAAIDALLRRPLHGLVNAAGVPGTLAPDVVAGVNVLALRQLTDGLLPHLSPGGAIVNVASTAGALWRERLALWMEFCATTTRDEGRAWFAARGWDGPTTYDRGKEAIIVLSQQRALDRFRRDGVRVCTVSPGATRTPILSAFYDSMDRSLLDAIRTGVGRDAVPEDIAPVIAFLLSDEAHWVNGVDLQADGGGEAGLATGTIKAGAP